MKQIRTITLQGGQGLTAEISNYGAKVLRLIVPNKQGEKKDIVLGFNTMDEWQQKETYFNAIIDAIIETGKAEDYIAVEVFYIFNNE